MGKTLLTRRGFLTGMALMLSPISRMIHTAAASGDVTTTSQATPQRPELPTWQALGGMALALPIVAYPSDGNIETFVVGADHQLYRSRFDGLSWGNWQSLGGQFVPDRVAAQALGEKIIVVGVNPNGTPYAASLVGESEANWISLGGTLTAPPVLFTRGDEAIVVGLGTDNGIYVISRSIDGIWGQWRSLNGRLAAMPRVTQASSGELDLVGIDDFGAVWHFRL